MQRIAVPNINARPVASRQALPEGIAFQQNQPWVNWGQTAHCLPDYTFHPRTVGDLIEIVHFAHESGRKIRAVATGHSWSALVPTDEILVSVQKLNHVAMDLSDPDHPRVVMECGATVREVNDVLERAGYALPFNVVLESVRFGGLIATGSHGSGWDHETLSDLVHSIEIVTANGELRCFETGVDNEEVMNAARLNLGMFGLIYRITLNVEATYTVRALDRRIGIRETLDNLQEWVPAHENMDIFWWPFCDRFWVKQWDCAWGQIAAKPRRSLRDNVTAAIDTRFFRSAIDLLGPFPTLTPHLSRTAFVFTPSHQNQIIDLVEAIHYRRSIELFRLGCVEIAFKVDDDFANVKWAMQLVLDQTQAYAARGQYPINVTMNVRFVHNSHCWLSPAFGDGHTCYIEILSRTNQPQWEEFSGNIAREWLTLPHALPHWAKEYRHIPGVVEHIRQEMGPNIARFNQIKASLGVDPHHMFVNDTLRELFLPTETK